MENKYLIRYNPLTPSMRHTCLVNKRNLSNGYKINKLYTLVKKNSGRNNSGKIVVRHHGGGYKNIYRKIDFKREILNIPGRIYTIEYDPNRSSFISLVSYVNGIYCYILATQFNIKNRLFIYNYNNKVSYYHLGDSNFLLFFSNGSVIHNVESFPGKGGLFARSAGTHAVLINGDIKNTKVKISSDKIVLLSSYCRASFGKISNSVYRDINLGKAGRSRWLGIRPNVRGVAMNPIDHPHGGGEGKKTGRASPYTVWGRMQKTKN
jgi:large subunit ribosomal protein L2